MKLYYVSAIIQEKNDARAWMLPFHDCAFNLEKAMEQIEFMRANHTVLSVWVDCFDEKNKKSVVFHECYVDVLGRVGLEGD